jgi:hypothetical protein
VETDLFSRRRVYSARLVAPAEAAILALMDSGASYRLCREWSARLCLLGLLAMAGWASLLVRAAVLLSGRAAGEATPTALLLNVVSLLFAAINYWRGKLINWRIGVPVLIAAVILSPLGARLTPLVDTTLLAMFAAFYFVYFDAVLHSETRAVVEPGGGRRGGRGQRGFPADCWAWRRQFHRARVELDRSRRQSGGRQPRSSSCSLRSPAFWGTPRWVDRSAVHRPDGIAATAVLSSGRS